MRRSLFFHEVRAQQRIFWRSREAAFFTFLLPIIFLVLLGSIYGDRDTIGGVKAGTYLLYDCACAPVACSP